ncbi:amidohydrolase family protein [Candidatus Puniceispirillum marinum]|jgi:predicted TIM-barrel fold metal-dependent hydrolase|nr:amidohydrolase family protein [Candidatus Puniceispirillum marinum]
MTDISDAKMVDKKSCMPPDPDTRTPVFKAPAKACDAHCHVFGPHDLFPYHPSSTYHPPDGPREKLAELHGKLGIERAVIVQASCHGPDNRAMLDAIKHNPDNYRGVCIANDSFSDEDFADLDAGGVRGVRFNFVTHLGGTPDLEMMKRVLERVQPLGWHLVIHVNAEDIISFQDFFLQFDMDIIVDHMGRVPTSAGVHQDAFQILKRFMERENWWVKICGSERISAAGPPFYDAVPYAQELVEIAPDRTLWGTDWPHPNIKKFMPNDGDLLDLVPLLARDETLQRKILVDNPARLYGFDDA